jgi:hypothetical protein
MTRATQHDTKTNPHKRLTPDRGGRTQDARRTQRHDRGSKAAGAGRDACGPGRRSRRRRDRLRRRATGRPGGPARQAVRGTRRPTPGASNVGRRHRPRPRLRHQCRQALQVRAARQAPYPPETDGRRRQALPLVAGPGAEARAPQARGCARRHGGLALAGKPLPIARFRGRTDFRGHAGFITVHPSYLLRMPDKSAKEQGYRDFVRDLQNIRRLAALSALHPATARKRGQIAAAGRVPRSASRSAHRR